MENNMLRDLMKYFKNRCRRLIYMHQPEHLKKAARKTVDKLDKQVARIVINQWHTKKAREFYFNFAE